MRQINKTLFRCLFAIAVLSFATGCATVNSFNSLPRNPSEFELSQDELEEKYPDIQEYKKRFRGLSFNTPLVQELVSLWGEPESKTKHWSYFTGMGGALAFSAIVLEAGAVAITSTAGIVLLIRPYPPESYIWNKNRIGVKSTFDF